MKMFGDHLGNIPVEICCDEKMTDVFASKTPDGSKIVITVVNKDISDEKDINFNFGGYKRCDAKIIYTENVRAYNTFENPDIIKESSFEGESIPPHSIVKFVFEK